MESRWPSTTVSARLIAPDRPGVMQTKWIKTLTVN